jgi:hypothetical protein
MTFIGIWLLSSCNEANFDEIKEIPVPENEKQISEQTFFDRKELAYIFGYQRGKNYVKIDVPKNVNILMLDQRTQQVDYYFFRKFNNWFEEVKFENGVLPIDQGESLDCDNFAMLYKSFMSIAQYKSGQKYEPAVGLVIVEQREAFGGIDKGSLHMLNIVFTSKEWYIFEPQTGKYTELQNYPNQKYIKTIII